MSIVGIDFGTTHCSAAIWSGDHYIIIPDEYGNTFIPSYVAFTEHSQYVGHDAKNQKDLNPRNVFYEVKRFIGRKSDDPVVLSEKDFLSYDLDLSGTNIMISSEYKKMSAEEVQSIIARQLKNMASAYLGKQISQVVVAVPAYFNDGQRQATRDAFAIAGLTCVRIINEPTAAGLAYGLAKRDEEKNIIVYDFGGGTLDVTLMTVDNGMFEVVASSGNTRLGGCDFDTKLMHYCLMMFNKTCAVNIRELSKLSIQKLRDACEIAKIDLTTGKKTTISVPLFHNNTDLHVSLTRSVFELVCADLFFLCMKPVHDILEANSMVVSDINEVILVGGMTIVPKVRELLKNMFGNAKINSNVNPMEIVAAGAAAQAHILECGDNPFTNNIVLVDATSLSMGIEVNGGGMSVIIPRGTCIPCDVTKCYTNDTDNVESIKIKIYEGERVHVQDNFLVGEFELSGLKPLPKGHHVIRVRFNIDINSCITVSADTEDSVANLVVKSDKGRLSQTEIARLIDEARDMEIYDKLAKQKRRLLNDMAANLENVAENIINNTNQELINKHAHFTSIIQGKQCDAFELQELQKTSDEMTKYFGILIYKKTKDIPADDTKSGGVLVYSQEEDDIASSELGNARAKLSELCTSILDILSKKQVAMSSDHKTYLRTYLDDILLWLHVHKTTNIVEYNDKICDVNRECNAIMMQYDNIFSDELSTREDLSDLCIIAYSLLEENYGKYPEFTKTINNIMTNIATTPIDEIDAQINIVKNFITKHTSANIITTNETSGGVSIEDIIKEQQHKQIIELLEGNDNYDVE